MSAADTRVPNRERLPAEIAFRLLTYRISVCAAIEVTRSVGSRVVALLDVRALEIREEADAERTQTDEGEHTRALPLDSGLFAGELTPKADSCYCKQHGTEEVEGDARR